MTSRGTYHYKHGLRVFCNAEKPPGRRDFTGVGAHRIFPRVREMLSEADAFIKAFVQDPGRGDSCPYNAGSSLFGNDDTITIPITERTNATDTAMEFLTRANMGFSSLPEYVGEELFRGSEYSMNALASYFSPQESRYAAASLSPLADYQKAVAETNKEWALARGIMGSTNRFMRISLEELGRLNTFLALFDKTFSDGVVPVVSHTNLDCTCRISWTVTGTASSSKGYTSWDVSLETGNKTVEYVTEAQGSSSERHCDASVNEADSSFDGFVHGSRDIKISKSDFQEKFRRTSVKTNELETVLMYIPPGYPNVFYVDVDDMRGVFEAGRDMPLELSGTIRRTNVISVRQPLQVLPVLPAEELTSSMNGSCPPFTPAKTVVDKGYVTEFQVQSAGAVTGSCGSNHVDKVWADARHVRSSKSTMWNRLAQAEKDLADRMVDVCIDEAKGLTAFPFNGKTPPDINRYALAIGDTIPKELTGNIITNLSSTASAPVFITQSYNGEVYARYVGDQDPILVYRDPGDGALREVKTEDGSYKVGIMSIGTSVTQPSLDIPYQVGSASASIRVTQAAHWKFKNLPLVEQDGAE